MTSYSSGTRSVRAPFGRSKAKSHDSHSGQTGGSGNIIINTHSARPDFGANIRVRPSSADDNENCASRQNGTAGSHDHVLLARREKANRSTGSLTPRSRGRPKGENEPDPFLSVDSVPEGKATEVMTQAWPERPKKRKMVAVEMLPETTRSADRRSLKSPGAMNKSTQSLNRSRGASPDRNFRSPSPTRPMYVSPNKEKKTNHHIRAPFKHSVNKPPMEPVHPDPAEEMKERTALATYQLSMVIGRENTPEQRKPTGHLWKGRLQPLYPVTVEGPSIYQCQGIQPEPRRPYIVGVPSHTVQRRQQIMATYPDLPPYGERPQTVESVHNTSRASSMAENQDQELILQMQGETLIDQPQETYYGDQYDPDQMIVDDELAMDEDIEIAAVTGTPSQVPFDAFRGEQGRNNRPGSGGSDKENLDHSEVITATPPKITPIGPVRCLRQDEHRPQTAPEDGRKSVRFADPPSSYNTTDIKNRSKSAGVVLGGVRVRQEVGVLPSVQSPRAQTSLSGASSASGLHAPKSPPQSIHDTTQLPAGPNVRRADITQSQMQYSPVPPPPRVPGSEVKVRTPRLGAPVSPIPPIGTKVPSPPTSPVVDKEPLEPSAVTEDELDPEVLMLQKWADDREADEGDADEGGNGGTVTTLEVEVPRLHRRCIDKEEPEVDEEVDEYRTRHDIPADEFLIETDIPADDNKQEKSEDVEIEGEEPVALVLQEMPPEKRCMAAMYEEVAEIDEELEEYYKQEKELTLPLEDAVPVEPVPLEPIISVDGQVQAEADSNEVEAVMGPEEPAAVEEDPADEAATTSEEQVVEEIQAPADEADRGGVEAVLGGHAAAEEEQIPTDQGPGFEQVEKQNQTDDAEVNNVDAVVKEEDAEFDTTEVEALLERLEGPGGEPEPVSEEAAEVEESVIIAEEATLLIGERSVEEVYAEQEAQSVAPDVGDEPTPVEQMTEDDAEQMSGDSAEAEPEEAIPEVAPVGEKPAEKELSEGPEVTESPIVAEEAQMLGIRAKITDEPESVDGSSVGGPVIEKVGKEAETDPTQEQGDVTIPAEDAVEKETAPAEKDTRDNDVEESTEQEDVEKADDAEAEVVVTKEETTDIPGEHADDIVKEDAGPEAQATVEEEAPVVEEQSQVVTTEVVDAALAASDAEAPADDGAIEVGPEEAETKNSDDAALAEDEVAAGVKVAVPEESEDVLATEVEESDENEPDVVADQIEATDGEVQDTVENEAEAVVEQEEATDREVQDTVESEAEAVVEQEEATDREVPDTLEGQKGKASPEDEPDVIPSENADEADEEESNDAAFTEELVLAEETHEEAVGVPADAEPVETGQEEVVPEGKPEEPETIETIDDAGSEKDDAEQSAEEATEEAEEQAEDPGEDTVDSVPDRLPVQAEGGAVTFGASDENMGVEVEDVVDGGEVITEGDAASRSSSLSSTGKEVEALLTRQDSDTGSIAKTETDVTIEMDVDSVTETESQASKAEDDEEEEEEGKKGTVEEPDDAEEKEDNAKDDDAAADDDDDGDAADGDDAADGGDADNGDGERDSDNAGDADDTGNADDGAENGNQGNEDEGQDQNEDDNQNHGADDGENEDDENEEVQESGEGEEACQGSNCGTPEPADINNESSQGPCVDGHGCGTPEPTLEAETAKATGTICVDGHGCETPEPTEEAETAKAVGPICVDGHGCGTPEPTEEAETAKAVGPICVDGHGCGTPEPTEEAETAKAVGPICVDGHGCGTPEPTEEADAAPATGPEKANHGHDCVDGNGCGTPEPVQEAQAESSQVNGEELSITLPEEESVVQVEHEASGERVVPKKPKGPKIQRPYSGKGQSSAKNGEEAKRYKKYQSCRLAYSGNPEDEDERQGRDSSPERSLSKANVHKRVKKGRPKSAFSGSTGKSAPDSSVLRIGNKVVPSTDAEKKRILRRPRSAAGPAFSSSKASKEKEELIQLRIGKFSGDEEIRKSRPMSVSGRPISASVSASMDKPAWGGRPQSGTRQLLVLAPKMKEIISAPKKKLKFKIRGEKMESASGVSLNTLACSYCGSKGRRIMDYAGDTGFCVCSVCYKKMNEQADDNEDERIGNPTAETNANLDRFFKSLDENDAQVIEEEIHAVADVQDEVEPAVDADDDAEVAEILETCVETEEADEEVNRICSAREDMREQPAEENTQLEADVLESGRSAKVCVMCGLEDSCCICGPDTKFVPDSSLLEKISYSKLENVRDGIKQSRIAEELKRLEDLYGVYSDDSETDGEDEEIGGAQVPVESSASDPDDREELQAYKEQCESANLGKMSGTLTEEKLAKKPPRIRPGSAQRRSSIQNGKVVLLEHTISHQDEDDTADSIEPTANQQTEENAKLEVVANTKTILKPRSEPEDSTPVAPYPPLCFKINARPPQGYLYYFAYGTDMNAERLQIYLGRDMTDRFWGLLYGFKLVFNKRGSDVEAGGFANIEFNPYSSVEGCLFLITPAELAILDKYVGYPEHYEHAMFPTWLLNCTEPDLYGVAQYCVPALTYIAQDKWTQKPTDPALSTEYNIKECLKNADLLTPAYKHNLNTQLEAAQEQSILQ
ncbi:uncharacterized protein LOC135501590 [Lineus longissimus]|uniref:uncharacterized protein LOC135501590 n=1 Tax=Lineus longissimus TaxID=88925 RepID=UPI002B4F8D4C